VLLRLPLVPALGLELLRLPLVPELLRLPLAPELLRLPLVPELGLELLRLPVAPELELIPAGEALLVRPEVEVDPAPAGEALLAVPVSVVPPVLMPAAPVLGLLRPLEPRLALPELDTPSHGATVGEVVVLPVGEMVTPATLQFSGMRCSMIST